MRDIDVIQRQLDRVLAFFPRIESRINGLFGVNTLIFVIATVNLSAGDFRIWYVTLPAIALTIGLMISYFHLLRANFPDVNGGESRLVFFKTIKERTEIAYRDALTASSDAQFRDDLIGQIWRNSCILCDKYKFVKKAIIATTISLVPFFVFLAATAIIHERIPVLRG